MWQPVLRTPLPGGSGYFDDSDMLIEAESHLTKVGIGGVWGAYLNWRWDHSGLCLADMVFRYLGNHSAAPRSTGLMGRGEGLMGKMLLVLD